MAGCRRVTFLLWTFSCVVLWMPVFCIEERSRSEWHREKVFHRGIGLSDADLRVLHNLRDMDHFKEVLRPLLQPRIVGTQGHDDVRQHIVSNMRQLDWHVEESSFQDNTPHGVKTFTNIIATLDPDASRRLVLACHYDSKIMKKVFIGATDSSVPCAMMINLANVLHQYLQQHKLKRYDLTLQLVFFDGEEAFKSWTSTDSLYGSRYMADRLQNTPFPPGNDVNLNELHRIDVLVLLDLIGTRQSSFYNYFPSTKDWYNRLISFEQRLGTMNLSSRSSVMFNNQDRYGYGIQDDHIPFLKRNVDVIHLIPVPFPDVWHKYSDNESALHYPTIEKLNVLLTAFVVDYLHVPL